MSIDENDITDLPRKKCPVTIEGWGTGTVAELEHYLHQLKDERDTARHALADLERRTNGPDALDGALDALDGADLVALISRIAERVAERVAERAAERAAGETDADAIWVELEDRVEEAAANAARDVIRDELVVNVDLV